MEWQPIDPITEPIRAATLRGAWLYGPFGVIYGTFGRYVDGHAFGSAAGLYGCVVRDWGATHGDEAEITRLQAALAEYRNIPTQSAQPQTAPHQDAGKFMAERNFEKWAGTPEGQ